MSDYRKMIFRENRDKFLVEVSSLPLTGDEAEGAERFHLIVLHVYRNDPTHGIQYKEGDEFDVLRTKAWPPGWSLSHE